MSSKVEKIEKNIATIKLFISKEDFEEGIEKAYNKNKSRFNIDGFRKGKAPRKIIERKFGENIFYEDALDFAFPKAFEAIIEENNLEVVAAPEMKSLEKLDRESGVEMTIEVALKPDFELGKYKGIEIDKIEYTVTDEDVDNKLSELQEKNSRLVNVEDTESKLTDTVVIDFEGFVDDVAFEGGKGEKYPLVLGSNSFIPGFEEQLVGKKAGEEVDVNVSFPNEYHSIDLAGKASLFKVKIHEVKTKQLPEIDDEFAMDVSEFDTLNEFKEDLKVKIKAEKEEQLKNQGVGTLLEKIVEDTKIDIPSGMLRERTAHVKEQFENQIKQNGIDMKTYFELMKAQDETKTEESFEKMFEEQALVDIKQELVITKLIEVENITISEEDKEEELKQFAKAYSQDFDEFKENVDEYTLNYIENFVSQRKLFDFLIDNAKQK